MNSSTQIIWKHFSLLNGNEWKMSSFQLMSRMIDLTPFHTITPLLLFWGSRFHGIFFMDFFLNGAELSLNSVISENSGNLINHWSMNWAQFKETVSHMCLARAVVASWSLHKRWQVRALLMTNIFVTEFAEFSENIYEKILWASSYVSVVCKWMENDVFWKEAY